MEWLDDRGSSLTLGQFPAPIVVTRSRDILQLSAATTAGIKSQNMIFSESSLVFCESKPNKSKIAI